jgi:hypothetical protein
VAIERQVFNLLTSDEAAHLMVFAVDQCGGGIDHYSFAHRTHLKSEVERGGGPRLNVSGVFQRVKPRCFRRHTINSRRQRRRAVVAFCGDFGGSAQPGCAIGDGDSYPRHDCASRVSQNSGDCSGRRLGVGHTDCRQHYQQKH